MFEWWYAIGDSGLSFNPQDTYDGLVFSRMPTRERKMHWSRYENDTPVATEVPFPYTGLLDMFNRANGPLLSPWLFGYYGWAGAARLAINTNRIAGDPATGDFAGQYADTYYRTVFGPDMEGYCTIGTVSGGVDWVEITLRTQNIGADYSGYGIAFAKGDWTATQGVIDGAAVVRYNKGARQIIARFNNAFTLAAGDKIGGRVVGNTITVWRQPSGGAWTKIGTVLDTAVSGKGRISLYVENTTMAIDDFGGGSYTNFAHERGVWFNTPALLSPGNEWAHPYFWKLREYNPVCMLTFREVNRSGFTMIDYRSSSPNTVTTSSANDYLTVEKGPIAGTKAAYIPRNGTSLSVSVSSMANLPSSQITVGTWVRMNEMVNWPNYVNHEWAGVGSWLLYNSTTAALFGVVNAAAAQQNAALIPSAGAFDNGEWHFVVGTYDGTTVRVYVDAVLGQTSMTAPGITLDNAGNVSFMIGAFDYAQGPTFILPTALTQEQIKGLYDIALSYPLVADPLDRYHVTSISGIDGPELRDGRADNPGNHGEAAYQAFMGGKNISITGQIRASNMARLRHMVKRLREECNADQGVAAALDNIFWKQFPGTFTIFDSMDAEPVQFAGRVIDLKIEEQQKSAELVREFRMTIRCEDAESGITGSSQLGTTTNLIGGATYYDPGLSGTFGSKFDAIVRIGNYPSGATSRITGDLVIQNGQGDQITFTNPVWGTDEWWEIDSRDGSVRRGGLNGTASNRFSFVKLSGTSPQFLRASSSAQFWSRTGTVSTGTPKFALFLPDNPYL